MNALLFQLVFQAATTALSLSYAKQYGLGQKQYDQERKRCVKNNVAGKNNNRASNSSGTAAPSFINTKATRNEPCSP